MLFSISSYTVNLPSLYSALSLHLLFVYLLYEAKHFDLPVTLLVHLNCTTNGLFWPILPCSVQVRCFDI